jgi:hypothetical protein
MPVLSVAVSGVSRPGLWSWLQPLAIGWLHAPGDPLAPSSDFVKAGLCGATSMHDVCLGPRNGPRDRCVASSVDEENESEGNVRLLLLLPSMIGTFEPLSRSTPLHSLFSRFEIFADRILFPPLPEFPVILLRALATAAGS